MIKNLDQLCPFNVSSVDVSVKRVGGAYGSKITRPNIVAAACALGAHVTRR